VIAFTDITGLASSALTIAAACLLVPGVSRLSRARLGGLLSAVFVVALIPLGDLPLAAYIRGITGDLSIAALLLMSSNIFRKISGTPAPEGKSRFAGLALIAIAALLFYPLALGVGMFDPYRLGYGDPWLLVGLFVLTLATVFLKQTGTALGIALAVLAWDIGWYESGNLWDYLLDPLVSIYAIAALIRQGARELRPGKKDTALRTRAD